MDCAAHLPNTLVKSLPLPFSSNQAAPSAIGRPQKRPPTGLYPTVNRLEAPILAQIFKLVELASPSQHSQCPTPIFLLTWVCRAWRNASFRTPHLWTRLDMSITGTRQNLDQYIESLPIYIQRSHNLPISLRIRATVSCPSAFWSTLANFQAQILELSFQGLSTFSSPSGSSTSTLLNLSFPRLSSLVYLSDVTRSNLIPIGILVKMVSMTSLTTLAIHATMFASAIFSEVFCLQLRHLTLFAVQRWELAMDVFARLTTCLELTTLVLHLTTTLQQYARAEDIRFMVRLAGPSGSMIHSYFLAEHYIIFPSLRSLTVSTTRPQDHVRVLPMDWLWPFRTPQLTTLTIEGLSYNDIGPVWKWFKNHTPDYCRRPPSIQHLRLLNLTRPHRIQDFFEKIGSNLQSLLSLEIRGSRMKLLPRSKLVSLEPISILDFCLHPLPSLMDFVFVDTDPLNPVLVETKLLEPIPWYFRDPQMAFWAWELLMIVREVFSLFIA
ncbi:hypothetical protein DL96DRAFT_1817669 [Flagelloscypha sp. PMI_526]|nr:hypothetical protein DL96DRAFT_1817669 [Flagelloscypha sp. PMI_526]